MTDGESVKNIRLGRAQQGRSDSESLSNRVALLNTRDDSTEDNVDEDDSNENSRVLSHPV